QLHRIGVLAGNVWTKEEPKTPCRVVVPNVQYTEARIPETMSYVPKGEEQDEPREGGDLPSCICYMEHVKEYYGFDNIIIIGELHAGILFLDCWMLGDYWNEATKTSDQRKWGLETDWTVVKFEEFMNYIPQLIDSLSENASLYYTIASEETIIPGPSPEIEHSPTKSEPSATSFPQDDTSKQTSENASDIASNSKSLEDKVINEFLDESYKKRVSDDIRQRKHEKKLQCGSPSQEAPSTSQNTASTSHKRKNEQRLIREIISSKEEKHVNEISANLVHPNNETSITLSIPAIPQLPSDNEEIIIGLYKNACDAEIGAIKANGEEILHWCFYDKEFKSNYKDFMVSNKVGEKKAKGQVYDFIIKQQALRIDNLFEKIGMNKIQYIKTYSADTISKFTNSQIQMIIDHFTKKPDIEFTDDQNNL
ncbi:5646_t:CDS:2, partial [Acaulospora morrowiae]